MPLQCTGTVTLGGVVLSDDLLLRNLRAPRVQIEQQRTKGGINQTLVHQLDGGRRLELYGFFTTDQGDQVQALEGLDVTLVHPRGTFAHVLVEQVDIAAPLEHVERVGDDLEQGSIYILER